ncbi:uncharacterized protein LOC131351398 isoform X2 [Hemibagrus wyckioides]|uniref:uncharacterized protein LOC131351398 isoform X2 n=1 Tax=Hemibagrus wyckioides TaxID=337641 RepID=UPI00266DD581|nr:uncharacterized protein LOC131351398 isoform X2 [Hemibagrus wyckioides]
MDYLQICCTSCRNIGVLLCCSVTCSGILSSCFCLLQSFRGSYGNRIRAIFASVVFFGNIAYIQRPLGHSVTVLTILVVLMFVTAVILAACGLRIHLTVCLEILNLALFGLLFCNNRDPHVSISQISCVLAPSVIVKLMLLTLQRHFFQGKPFGYVQIALSSLIVLIFSLGQICVFILFSVTLEAFVKRGWMILFEGVMFIFAWFLLICLLRLYRGQRRCCCSAQWRKIGYLCCSVMVVFVIAVHCIVYFSYVNIIVEAKDRSGYLALTPLIHILAATCLFKHPKYLPDFHHVMIYMFGAVGLTTVNAIALIIELTVKAGAGARTIGDMRVIVLTLETVFVSFWLVLQIYDAWMRVKDRIKCNFEDEKVKTPESCLPGMTFDFPEMTSLSVQPS